jgi:hypothetical protein
MSPVLSPPSADIDSTFTVGYLIDRTFDFLLGGGREELNQLTSTIDDETTSIDLNYTPAGLAQGTYLAVDDEIMFVWAVSSASGTASVVTVQRGMKGTQPAGHLAGAIVQVNPYFPKYQVRKTLQDEIRSWGPQVFAVKTIDIAGVDFVRGYDLTGIGAFFFGLDLTVSPDPYTGVVSSQNWRRIDYRIDSSADVSVFPSGAALFVTDPVGMFDTPRTLHLTYAAPLDVDSSFLDNDSLIEMGMDASDADIAPYGAAYRLASGREMRRMLIEGQGQISDLQNFPPGYQLKAAEEFKSLRDSRLQDAIQRLRTKYPIRRIS